MLLALHSSWPPSWAGLGGDGGAQSASHIVFTSFPFLWAAAGTVA